jgi:hypothetical protein
MPYFHLHLSYPDKVRVFDEGSRQSAIGIPGVLSADVADDGVTLLVRVIMESNIAKRVADATLRIFKGASIQWTTILD